MTAEIIRIASDPEAAFSRAREAVRSGGVIVYPTDTLYGLGADPLNAAAVRRLFEVKGRRGDQPILLLLGETGDVRRWAEEVSPKADALMKRFWPGPLTILFRARAGVLPELVAGTGAIGLRVPGFEPARDLLRFLGTALTGTSANVSGGPGAKTAEEAAAALGSRVDLILDGGPARGTRPSTIVDARAGVLKVIREGAVDVF